MKRILDIPAIKTAFRTAGALMVGNALIAPLLFENRNWLGVLSLFSLGVCLIVVNSFKGD